MLLDYTYSGIIHIDKYGRILQVNRFVETLLMMESSAMIQMPVWRIIPGITKRCWTMYCRNRRNSTPPLF